MSTRLAAGPISMAARRLPSRRIGGALLALAVVALLTGCATGTQRGHLTNGFGPHSPSRHDGSAPGRPEAAPAPGEATGGSGELPEDTTDPFQVVQEASGLG